MTLLALFGGLALLLYGMQLIGEGLQRAAGGHLRHLLTSMTRTRLAAVASGALVTSIIQSSSATTLMLIGFVSAGLVTFPQSLGVILGADIGTTVTVQLLAFKVQELSLLLVGAGFAMSFFARRGLVKSLGQVILGFGFIFLGMKVMNDGLAPLTENELTRQVLVALADNQFLALLVGAVLSASMASSAATIGLTLSLGHQGLLPLDAAIPVVLGANIGTCATALAASLRSSSDARRVAVAHIAFKVLGVALVFPFIGPLTSLVAQTAGDVARQIANAHTFFNVAISALFLPFAPWAARVITALVPEEERGDNPYRTRYLDDRYLDQPALAIGQATREALRMGDVAQSMLRDAMVVLRTDNQELLEDVERRDDQLDYLDREIKLFIARLGRETMSADMAQKEIALISFIGNLENIGDIIDKNLMELARKKLYQGRRFSEAGEAELIEFHSLVSKNLERAIASFAANDRSLAQEVLDMRPLIRQRERELRDSHLARLRRGLAESLETSEIHLDVLTNLKRISSHITALVYPILEEESLDGAQPASHPARRLRGRAVRQDGRARRRGGRPAARARRARARRAHPAAQVPGRGGAGRRDAGRGAEHPRAPGRSRGRGRPDRGRAPRPASRCTSGRARALLRSRQSLRHRDGDYWDNCERFVFFCRAALEGMARLDAARPGIRWQPQVDPRQRLADRAAAGLPPHALPRSPDAGQRWPACSRSTTWPTRACSGTTTCR